MTVTFPITIDPRCEQFNNYKQTAPGRPTAGTGHVTVA